MFKETKEVISALFAMVLFLIGVFKDGFQFQQDATAIYEKVTSDEEFKRLFLEAYAGYKTIGSEFKGVGFLGYFGLAMFVLAYVPQFVKAFEKPAA